MNCEVWFEIGFFRNWFLKEIENSSFTSLKLEAYFLKINFLLKKMQKNRCIIIDFVKYKYFLCKMYQNEKGA